MESFQKAMQDAQEELARLEQRRAKLLQLIEDLKALSGDEFLELTPPPGYEPEGPTAEIRKILSLSTVHLTATQIRDSLMQRGFEKSNPKTLLIAVHTVLGRIDKELDVIERDGKPAYKAKPLSNALTFYEIAVENALKQMRQINIGNLSEMASRGLSDLDRFSKVVTRGIPPPPKGSLKDMK